MWLAILAWRLFQDAPVSRLWLDFLFLFLLFGYIAATAFGIGRITLQWFKLPFSDLEFNVASLLIGLGLLSMSVMVVGMVGFLTREGIFACLAIAGFAASSEWYETARQGMASIRAFRVPQTQSVYERLVLILCIALLPVLIANALTPIWDYDALLYHLEIPEQYLLHGRIYFDPEVFRSAYPFLGEMLFLAGMIFRLDSLAKLINLLYAILFVLSTYAFAHRFFSRETALTAVGILISAPAFPLWSTWAGIDYAWAVYEFWAVFALSLWLVGDKTSTRNWLVLCGLMSGFAASTKYLSLPALLIVAAIILWKSIQGSKQPMPEAFRNLFLFGISAAAVMGVWYIKNWIWTGNPVYPLVFGGIGWDPVKDLILKGYLHTFGVGRNWLDYLLLPYNLYAHQDRFSTSIQEVVHPLLWLAFLFPFLRGREKYPVVITYAALYYVWWLVGSQIIRFLLPLSAFFAILAGGVIEKLPGAIRNGLKIGLIAGVLILSIVYQATVLNNSGAFLYITGQRPAKDLLLLFVDDYGVKQHIQTTLDQDKRVQFLWDGRGYYCDERCIPDDKQSQAVRWALNSPLPATLAAQLISDGITHLMLNRIDAGWFIEYHDPGEHHQRTLEYFETNFLPACGKSIYKDAGVELYELVCD